MRKNILLLLYFFSYCYCHEYPKPFMGYYSQKGQDKFLNEEIFHNKKNGIFVEVGAHDGISFSNTYFFEKFLNWTGICVEPNPDIFKQLKQNRKCYCERVCIADKKKTSFLKCAGYMLEMYSGILNYYDPRHLKRIDDEMAQYGGSKEIITVDCITFEELFKKYELSYIDLLSIDIEGGEEAAIKTINFDLVTFNVIVVENNFNENEIKNYLLSKGYQYIIRIGKDDIYQLNR